MTPLFGRNVDFVLQKDSSKRPGNLTALGVVALGFLPRLRALSPLIHPVFDHGLNGQVEK